MFDSPTTMIASVLGIFFLCVAIAKGVITSRKKRKFSEEARQKQGDPNADVHFHLPYKNAEPIPIPPAPDSQEPAPAQPAAPVQLVAPAQPVAAPAAAQPVAAPAQPAAAPPADAAPAPSSPYRWR